MPRTKRRGARGADELRLYCPPGTKVAVALPLIPFAGLAPFWAFTLQEVLRGGSVSSAMKSSMILRSKLSATCRN